MNFFLKITFAVILTVPFSVKTSLAQNFLGGAVLGINATEVDGDQMGGMNKISTYTGFFVEYPFTKKVSGSIEFAYSREGSRAVVYKDGTYQDGAWFLARINYVDVPLSIHYLIKDAIRAHAGIAGAYMLNYYVEEFPGIPNTYDEVPFRRYDLTGHAGLEYGLVEEKFNIIGRFNYSLLNFGRGKTVIGRASGLRNKLIMIGGRYYF